jgi:hypothetical protein
MEKPIEIKQIDGKEVLYTCSWCVDIEKAKEIAAEKNIEAISNGVCRRCEALLMQEYNLIGQV